MFGKIVGAAPPLKALLFASLAVATTPAVALAETSMPRAQQALYYDPSDGNQRINLSGRLRMLSQRIAGMACNKAAGIERDVSRGNLEAAVAEFSTILNSLEYGDPALNIFAAEENVGIVRGVRTVKDRWQDVSQMAEAVLAGDVSEATVDVLAGESTLLLKDAQRLVVRVVEFHYDRVNTLQSVAFTIDFAGRQRMLAQKMSKNICLIHMDSDTDAALEGLRTAYTLFDATLDALQSGMPQVGVSPPPNATVADGLAVVAASWAELEPMIMQALDGERFDDATRVRLFNDLNALTAEMNAAVQMYVAASRKAL